VSDQKSAQTANEKEFSLAVKHQKEVAEPRKEQSEGSDFLTFIELLMTEFPKQENQQRHQKRFAYIVDKGRLNRSPNYVDGKNKEIENAHFIAMFF